MNWRIGIYLVVISLFVGCSSTDEFKTISPQDQVVIYLHDTEYSKAQKAYFKYKKSDALSPQFVDRYDRFFSVIALYDYDYDSLPDANYRYASCIDLTKYGEAVIEWRSIAAPTNPFLLSNNDVKAVKEQLRSEGLWAHDIDEEVTVEFQKAIIYYRLLHGMNVECILYPYALMLESTYCSLFTENARCKVGYEF